MSKELRELLAKLAVLETEAQVLLNDDKATAAQIKAKADEIKALKAKIEAQKMLDEGKTFNENGVEVNVSNANPAKGEGEVKYVDVFLKYMRNLALRPEERKPFTQQEKALLSSNTDADGRLLIPQDIRTQINTLRRSYLDMYDYVNVELVGTATGSRVIEKEAAYTPFEGVAELTAIPDMGNPQFAKISFAVNDFKGILEIPNSLLKDENADLMGYLSKWIAKKLVATHNSLIFYADGTKAQGILGVTSGGFTIETATAPADIKKFKSILNKQLPQAIALTAKIITNQTGFDYLDGLEDAMGRPYLQPDPTGATPGKFLGKQVIVFDDATLQNKPTTGEAPFLIGDPREALTYFDREQLSVASSSEAGFENDATKVRAITRGDSKFVDTKALYVLYSPVA